MNRVVARYETTAVYRHPDAVVDIVLVHGLNGDPGKTWTARNGTFWPTDLLPKSLKGAQANVLVYGYNADVYCGRDDNSASDNFIHQHAQTLVTSLTLYRKSEGTFNNPIIWVCHSLGGILVKRALLYSNDLRAAHHEDYRSIFVSTYGIMFLGTPHTGSDAASWALVLQAMSDAVIPRKSLESESVLLRTLKKDNETLANINNHFLDIYQRFKIHMVHENHKTDIKGTKIMVVDPSSASPQLPGVTYYGVEATHAQLCKFENASSPGFRALSTDIRQWVLEAPDFIAVRWDVEEHDKAARMQYEVQERMSGWMTPPAYATRTPSPARGFVMGAALPLVMLPV
ncbi:Alpha/Beta hydrolase protein [Trichoderma ceciliae]